MEFYGKGRKLTLKNTPRRPRVERVNGAQITIEKGLCNQTHFVVVNAPIPGELTSRRAYEIVVGSQREAHDLANGR